MSQLDSAAPYVSDEPIEMPVSIVDQQMDLTDDLPAEFSSGSGSSGNGWMFLTTLLYLALSIGALYLAFRCGKGFSIIHLLLAFFFPICYIPYGLYACL